MNTYLVYPKGVLDSESLGTVTGMNIDEAQVRADTLYGVSTTLVRQYDTGTISLDPLWIIAALLILGYLAKKGKNK